MDGRWIGHWKGTCKIWQAQDQIRQKSGFPMLWVPENVFEGFKTTLVFLRGRKVQKSLRYPIINYYKVEPRRILVCKAVGAKGKPLIGIRLLDYKSEDQQQ